MTEFECRCPITRMPCAGPECEWFGGHAAGCLVAEGCLTLENLWEQLEEIRDLLKGTGKG